MKRRPALLVCVLAAASLHLLLLLWPVGPRGVASGPPGGAALRVVNLQMALPTTAAQPEPQAVVAAPAPVPAPAEDAASEPPVAAVPPAAPGPAGATEGVPLAIEPDWWPREQLDSGPQPLRPVLFDTARAGSGLLPAGSNALLHIDELGRVQRVEFGGTPLPKAAEDALRAAFVGTPFAPGERGGRPVRAKVRIAVDLMIDLNEGGG